jgi:hypothetical protein
MNKGMNKCPEEMPDDSIKEVREAFINSNIDTLSFP